MSERRIRIVIDRLSQCDVDLRSIRFVEDERVVFVIFLYGWTIMSFLRVIVSFVLNRNVHWHKLNVTGIVF